MSATHLRGRKTVATRDSDPIKRKPPAPEHLTPFAVKEWDRVWPMMIERELACKADIGFVESYCMARGLIVELEARRRIKGADLPKLLRLQNQAMLTAARLSASLGLDPSSRARLMAAGDGMDDDGPNPLDV